MQAELLSMSDQYKTTDAFRLHRLSVYNWGTFHQHVWELSASRENSLLTGGIGSGKSTLVDAMTTLLVPHHRIVYNKAAGAEGKERTLYSYIRGEYKSEKDEFAQAARAVFLRDENHYTVILANFHCDAYGTITLAQVFWLKDKQRVPEKFFVVAQRELSIEADFSQFGEDVLLLKKRLRQLEKVEVFDQFKEYSRRFRYFFGIQTEQALELFYQTISMKSVGNLTEFVRTHMLEKDNIEQRVEELCHHFEDLNRAHAAVLKAREQVELLTNLMREIKQHRKNHQQLKCYKHSQEILPSFFAEHHVCLIKNILKSNEEEQIKHQRRLVQFQEAITQLRNKKQQLQENINTHGGQRIVEIEKEIFQMENQRSERQNNHQHYLKLIEKLALEKIQTENKFYSQYQIIKKKLKQIEEEITDVQKNLVTQRLLIKELEERRSIAQAELGSLLRRKTNIPERMVMLRQELVKCLNIPATRLPFVGELIQVKESEQAWLPAIEKLLHGFGLSLLVPEEYYAVVSHYVNSTNLKGRLVYFKIKPVKTKPLNAQSTTAIKKLVNKLLVKQKNECREWLVNELESRFDFICCDQLSEFQLLPRAITKNGLIKTNQQRHEKDDRHQLGDSRYYVLGWDNKEKIQALQQQIAQIDLDKKSLESEEDKLLQQQSVFTSQRDACRDLLQIKTFSSIDWMGSANAIEQLQRELDEIQRSSNILATLREQLSQTACELAEVEQNEKDVFSAQGALLEREKYYQEQLSALQEVIAAQNACLSDQEAAELLENYFKKILNGKSLTLKNVSTTQSQVNNLLKRNIDKLQQKEMVLSQTIIRLMNDYQHRFPAETKEIDASIAAADEYENMLMTLRKENLPKHEKRFKELLTQGTINSIALFQNQLNQSLREIYFKIDAINRSLRDIEYSAGTFIKIVTDANKDIEIRAFRQELSECLSNTLSDELYTEQKFEQVKTIIERFKGRKDSTDMDKRWTKKVTDVRNWVIFSAVELFSETNEEKEFYTDSSGKSGGQKEKLAYTVLASALAYQFGLSRPSQKERSFRFVVIDEAFARGSDDSTHYALKLFSRLDLQLLIVTPLQKIHVIENYVRSVNYVYNQDGNKSMLQHLTIEAYQKQQAEFLEEGLEPKNDAG